MLSASEIRNVRFSKAMGGYKQEEVDVLLDKVEADYEQFEHTIREMNGRINQLKEDLNDAQNSQGNIQNILVSAQKFADQIVEEAKVKSAEIIASAQANIEKITAQEKELTNAFDKKAGEIKTAYQTDLDKIVETAQKKQIAVETATQDCIDRQQLLFNKMKIEIAAFKAEITAKYKEHLELLSSLPDTVPNDPAEVAKAVSLEFDTMPTVSEYAETPEAFNLSEPEQEVSAEQMVEEIIDAAADDAAEEITEDTVETQKIIEPAIDLPKTEEPAERLIQAATGFVINTDFDFDDEE